MDESKPTKKDNVIGVTFFFATILLTLFGMQFVKLRILAGIPFTLYGIYGLIKRRIWAIGGYGAGGSFCVKNKWSIIVSIFYIIFGVFFSLSYSGG